MAYRAEFPAASLAECWEASSGERQLPRWHPPPPPPPKAEAPKVIAVPVRVGGNVRSPRLVKRVEPEYPLLAKASRIKGSVRLEAILTEEGKVADLKLVSGHPLLVESAMKAARQWEYEPTYLNDIPARVILFITVNFSLQF